MRVITDINFQHESISGLTLVSITKQNVVVREHLRNAIGPSDPHAKANLLQEKFYVLEATGEPDVEEITIGP